MHAGREQTFVNAFPAHAAFFHVTFRFIIARRAKRTVTQTVAATDARILIVNDDAIFALRVRADGAAFQTRGLIAMVTSQSEKRAVFMRVDLFAQRIQLAPDDSRLKVVLIFASHSA